MDNWKDDSVAKERQFVYCRQEPRNPLGAVHIDIPKKIACGVTTERHNHVRVDILEFVEKGWLVTDQIVRRVDVLLALIFSIQIGEPELVTRRKIVRIEQTV